MLGNGGGGPRPLEDGDPRVVGGYRLTARLGSGGMGRVYLSHTPGGRAVAVKVIRPELAENPEFRGRFRAEVAAAGRVHGLYTAPVVDSDTEAAVPWCATAYVPGPSLEDAVREHGPLPVDTVLRLIAGVAEALQAVHREGIVHRDLKPSNVLLAADGPRVIDFGIARAADATSVTQSGTALGTVAYMAPEQVLGAEAGASADVFALGQTAVFASTGGAAFGTGDPHAVLYRVVHEEPDLAQVPDEIRDLVAACLRKPAAERPSVEEVIRTVQTLQTHRGDEAHHASGAWLPGELAAGIAARTEDANRGPGTGSTPGTPPATDAPPGPYGPATPPPTPTTPPPPAPAGYGPPPPPGAFGPPIPTPYGPSTPAAATPSPAHSPVPTPAALPDPILLAQAAPAWQHPQAAHVHPQNPSTTPTSSVGTDSTDAKKRGKRTWVLAAAAVALVASGAGAALLLVPGDKAEGHTQDVAASQSAAPTDSSPPRSPSPSPSPSGSKNPKAAKSAVPPSPSGPPAPTRSAVAAAPTAASSGPAAPTAPAPVTYTGIRMTKSHDIYLADTPVRSKADTGTSDEDLTYAVYSSGAVLAPGTDSGSSLALLPEGRSGALDTCKAATGYRSYVWVKDLTAGQQLCVISGTGHVGLVTYRGSSGTTYAVLDVKVWRNAA
ncbi:protein kinase [Streptomyces sp. NPDC092369]|uniref:protein kinase domain-containing protein n=1 Tax=Streptomyces sp. NPDC092369 TaxID=3366015 RepID=UPI0038178229